RRVKFISAEDLTNELIAANHSNTITDYLESMSRIELLHTPEQFGQPADLHPDTLPELIRTASRFIFGQF
ncbi:hypothetical protein, partial [Aliarcobacter butzleri]|uniref:hypothetical protein n=1 Tax=Aliarcobacter butzleri TaxID=28197 RepID=UPI002B24F0C1